MNRVFFRIFFDLVDMEKQVRQTKEIKDNKQVIVVVVKIKIVKKNTSKTR